MILKKFIMLDQDNQKVQNKKTDRRMLTRMFQDQESSEKAYNAMHERGYSEDNCLKWIN